MAKKIQIKRAKFTPIRADRPFIPSNKAQLTTQGINQAFNGVVQAWDLYERSRKPASVSVEQSIQTYTDMLNSNAKDLPDFDSSIKALKEEEARLGLPITADDPGVRRVAASVWKKKSKSTANKYASMPTNAISADTANAFFDSMREAIKPGVPGEPSRLDLSGKGRVIAERFFGKGTEGKLLDALGTEEEVNKFLHDTTMDLAIRARVATKGIDFAEYEDDIDAFHKAGFISAEQREKYLKMYTAQEDARNDAEEEKNRTERVRGMDIQRASIMALYNIAGDKNLPLSMRNKAIREGAKVFINNGATIEQAKAFLETGLRLSDSASQELRESLLIKLDRGEHVDPRMLGTLNSEDQLKILRNMGIPGEVRDNLEKSIKNISGFAELPTDAGVATHLRNTAHSSYKKLINGLTQHFGGDSAKARGVLAEGDNLLILSALDSVNEKVGIPQGRLYKMIADGDVKEADLRSIQKRAVEVEGLLNQPENINNEVLRKEKMDLDVLDAKFIRLEDPVIKKKEVEKEAAPGPIESFIIETGVKALKWINGLIP